MTENKPPSKKEITNDVLMADVMLRITAIEKLLIEKGIFTKEELNATTEEIAKRVAKVVLEKVQASKDIDEFISSLENKDKKEFNN
jgi:TPP-dependent pyruvate/acetoin dehydrogenase alpha subunit